MCACTHMRTRRLEFDFLGTYVSFRFFIQITQIGTDAICAHLCFSQHYRSKAHTFAKSIYPQSNIKSLLIFEIPKSIQREQTMADNRKEQERDELYRAIWAIAEIIREIEV